MTRTRSSEKPIELDLLFSALADKTRLRLLNLMGPGELCVCFLVESLATNQPKISRHLAYLRRAGIVGARRDGKWMHYRIVEPADPAAARILKEVLAALAEDPDMKSDRQTLLDVCCAPSLPAHLEGAPLPASIVKSGKQEACCGC